MEVYLDYAATSPIDGEVLKAMNPFFTENFGNAASLHQLGATANAAVTHAREIIAKAVGVTTKEVIFTSGGTESNNHAIKGVAFANQDKGKHIIIQKTEHDCVLNASKWLKKFGFETKVLDVDENGIIKLDQLKKELRPTTILVSIMHANNEIGTIQPIKEIGEIVQKNGTLFHTDACQSFTKEPLNLHEMNLDLITINSHKIFGPKGVGALIIKRGTKIDSLLHGGGHEFGKRSGTTNVHGIVGFGKAVEITSPEKIRSMKENRDYLIQKISAEIQEAELNGHPTKRLVNNVNMSFRGVEGEALLMRMSAKGISLSTGSACSSNTLQPSHTLLAIGRKPELAHASVRMTLGYKTTRAELDYVVTVLKNEVKILREMSATW